MDFAVIGGDARFSYLTRLLQTCGRDARALFPNSRIADVPQMESTDLDCAKNAVINWPFVDGENLISRLPKGARVYFCGPGTPDVIPEHIEGIDLWKDEQLLIDNAWLTAEGAISAAMNAASRAICDCHCLIIGWGRIGRALTEILIGMNARVTVASRSNAGRNGAIARGAEGIFVSELVNTLPGKQIIFTTPPRLVLGEAELMCADSDALVIDLASPPYGLDLETANRLNLRAWREPKLPGRYCPFSAAQALLRAILRAERKE